MSPSSSGGAFRAQDVVALACAAVAFLFAAQTSPDSSLRLVWYIALPSADTGASTVAPLVTDLNGDGRGEVLLLTGSPATVLKVYALPEGDGADGGGEDEGGAAPVALASVASVDVLGGLRVSAGRRPVALAAGRLSSAEAGQRVVVVREDWTVLCFDENLHLVWETPVGATVDALLGRDRRRFDLVDVAVLVTPEQAETSDGSGEGGLTGGLVVVSGRLQRQGLGGGLGGGGGGAAFSGAQADATVAAGSSSGGAEALAGAGGGALAPEAEAYVEHFSFFALDGATGSLAWSHEGSGGGPSAADAEAMAKGGGGGGGGSRSVFHHHQFKLDPLSVTMDLDETTGGNEVRGCIRGASSWSRTPSVLRAQALM